MYSMPNIIATNKKAFTDFEILEKVTAGIVLTGPEVKSAKAGQISLRGGFVLPRGKELFLENISISPYAPAKREQKHYQPIHPRKLLLTAKQISRLIGVIQQKHHSVVPIAAIVEKAFVKIELAIVRGKKLYDKRETIKKRELARKLQKMVRQ